MRTLIEFIDDNYPLAETDVRFAILEYKRELLDFEFESLEKYPIDKRRNFKKAIEAIRKYMSIMSKESSLWSIEQELSQIGLNALVVKPKRSNHFHFIK